MAKLLRKKPIAGIKQAIGPGRLDMKRASAKVKVQNLAQRARVQMLSAALGLGKAVVTVQDATSSPGSQSKVARRHARTAWRRRGLLATELMTPSGNALSTPAARTKPLADQLWQLKSLCGTAFVEKYVEKSGIEIDIHDIESFRPLLRAHDAVQNRIRLYVNDAQTLLTIDNAKEAQATFGKLTEISTEKAVEQFGLDMVEEAVDKLFAWKE